MRWRDWQEKLVEQKDNPPVTYGASFFAGDGRPLVALRHSPNRGCLYTRGHFLCSAYPEKRKIDNLPYDALHIPIVFISFIISLQIPLDNLKLWCYIVGVIAQISQLTQQENKTKHTLQFQPYFTERGITFDCY